MTGFTKLFSSIVHSTVWQEPLHVKVVWVTMLALADRNGVVAASAPGLAKASGVDLEQCLEALARLQSPDPYSRTKAHEGRRIREIDGGWQILNYLKYRELASKDERRIKVRRAVSEHRQRNQKKSPVITSNQSVISGNQSNHIAEADAEAKADVKTEASPVGRRPTWLTPYAVLWRRYFDGKIPFEIAAKNLRPLHEDHGEAEVLARMERYLQSTEAQYVSLPKFASTFGAWSGSNKAVSRPMSGSRQSRNEAVLDQFEREHGDD